MYSLTVLLLKSKEGLENCLEVLYNSIEARALHRMNVSVAFNHFLHDLRIVSWILPQCPIDPWFGDHN